MLLLALLFTLLGLYNLLVPRRFFLFGSRWQLRDGDRAEPSDTYVIAVRAGGVVFLIIALGLTIWHFSLEARESLSTAWDLSALPDGEVRVIDDPEVVQVENVEASMAALAGARMGIPTWKTAVVGRDDVGDLGVTVHDGDLWMAANAGPCTPAVLMVRETETSVTVAMTAVSSPSGVHDGSYLPCFAPGLQPTLASIVIVRVPLDDPLGEREVITVIPPERDDVGGPPVPIPGVPYNPETSAPTPTPTP